MPAATKHTLHIEYLPEQAHEGDLQREPDRELHDQHGRSAVRHEPEEVDAVRILRELAANKHSGQRTRFHTRRYRDRSLGVFASQHTRNPRGKL